MNEKQEEFILYCLTKALLVNARPYKHAEIKYYVYNTFKELGDFE